MASESSSPSYRASLSPRGASYVFQYCCGGAHILGGNCASASLFPKQINLWSLLSLLPVSRRLRAI